MTGILFIHGFTGSTDDFNFILPEIESFYKVKLITLTGHEKLKLRKVSYKDWLNDGYSAYESLASECDNIIIIGHSMGCVIASNLLILPNNKITKTIFLNPAFKHSSNLQFVLRLPRIISEIPFSLFRDKRPLRSLKRIFTPFSSIKQLRIICKLSLDNIPKIKQDILIIQGSRDGLVNKSYASYVYDNIKHGNKRIVLFKYWHNPFAASKNVRTKILKEVKDFINK